MPNRVVHFEIVADDMDVVQQFYEDVFDWEFREWEPPEEMAGEASPYRLITTGGGTDAPGIDGGMMTADELEQPVVNTIDVDDLDTMLESVETHGGTIVMEKQAVPDVGWAAYIKDPAGNMFGLLEADEMAGH